MSSETSRIRADFDRIALLESDHWNHNSHYHDFLLRHVPSHCRRVLEIGCGTGSFTRRLAQRSERVLAVDLSPMMIQVAQERSREFSNIDFQVAEVGPDEFPAGGFDCIAAIATLHHLPIAETLSRMKESLNVNGRLVVLDLFQSAPVTKVFEDALAMPVSIALRLLKDRRIRPSREVREAWKEHEQHDVFPTISEMRQMCQTILPGAQLRKHLLWRYSIVWTKHQEHIRP